jgi:DNA (cytosine-5)-methyltransferase 1
VRPRLLDLFCCAGGASAGYFRAGFDVEGVDMAPQPNYPHPFHLADATTFPLDDFDAVHASPPCQHDSHMTNCRPGLADEYPQLIDVMRKRLEAWGGPYVIENVEGSGLASQDDLFGTRGVMLCGSMFGLPLYRHRLFETSFPVTAPGHPRHLVPASKAGHWKPGTVISVAGNCAPIGLARQAMQIGWTTRDELAEAIPPVYAEHLGLALLAHLMAAEAAA